MEGEVRRSKVCRIGGGGGLSSLRGGDVGGGRLELERVVEDDKEDPKDASGPVGPK